MDRMLTEIQVGWGQQWDTLSTAIVDYYGGGVGYPQYEKVVQMLNSGEYTMEEMEGILSQIPEFSRTYNGEGKLVGVQYTRSASVPTSSAGSVAQQVNSNVNNATQTEFSTVQTVTKDAQTGAVTMSDNLVKYKTGQLAPTTMKGLGASAVGAIAATATGINLGKTIDQTLYNANPDFWDDHGMGALNPETWNTITAGDNSLNAKLFNFILGLDPTDKNPQLYMDETAFAYMTAYMISEGAFNHGGTDPWDAPTSGSDFDLSQYKITVDQIAGSSILEMQYFADALTEHGVTGEGYMICNGYIRHFFTNPNFSPSSTIRVENLRNPYYDGFAFDSSDLAGVIVSGYAYTLGNTGVWSEGDTTITVKRFSSSSSEWFGGNGCQYSFGVPVPTVPGITDQPDATVFDPSNISDPTDISSVLSELKTQYPELWNERVEVSPDGETTKVFIPVGFPTGGIGEQPTTGGATQTDLAPDISGDGENATDELIKTLIEMIQQPKDNTGMDNNTATPTKPVDPNGDPRGNGESPAIVTPTGSASALWKIYNPSQAQLDTFGAWLWSPNFVDQLLKLFNDPMQAIIGLHKVYVTPPISGSGPIKVGYLVSDANANYVNAQYTDFDCGDVDMTEYFNNVFDYDPFTKISIYLPFIGFRSLNVSDVMRGVVNVKYTVDVLTGTCLATISVTRDLNTCVLYTFSGNCAVQYPVSSGSYVGIVTGLLGIAGGIAGTIASGGALAPALMGTGASVGAMHTNIEHSGNVSANAGAMGAKKPYIVIERPQTKLPIYGEIIEGKPQNETVILGTLTGHVRVKAAEYNGFSCTANELEKIKNLLESGIQI